MHLSNWQIMWLGLGLLLAYMVTTTILRIRASIKNYRQFKSLVAEVSAAIANGSLEDGVEYSVADLFARLSIEQPDWAREVLDHLVDQKQLRSEKFGTNVTYSTPK